MIRKLTKLIRIKVGIVYFSSMAALRQQSKVRKIFQANRGLEYQIITVKRQIN